MEQLKVGIIADDWTGACDSGVQLVKAGLRVYTVSEPVAANLADADALVFDTDSRALPRDQAYARVRQAAELLAANGARLIYKKMDSTLRGNLGAELDAVYEALKPDLVVIAPAFPALGRCLIDGRMYVHGRPLHETSVATDPRTPVTESDMLPLLARQSSRVIGHVTIAQLSGDPIAMLARLAELREQGIRYVVFDADSNEQLLQLVKIIEMSRLQAIWAGSAGLASCLPISVGEQAVRAVPSISPGKPVLVAVGSVNEQSRQQLRVLLQDRQFTGVGLAPELAFDLAAREEEIARVVTACREAIAAGRSVALYTKAEPADISRGLAEGERSGHDREETSRLIAEMLGEAAAQVVRLCGIERLVLTGGDTARQVGLRLGATFSRLLGEVEPGVPISRLGESNIFTVTKAGGFGSDDVLVKACRYLERGSI